jgi:lysophospholipase L1-like esterase
MKNQLFVIFLLLSIFLFLSKSLMSQEAFSDEINKFCINDSVNAPILRGQILLYGSSTIRLWTSYEKDFKFKNLKVVNRGFGGSQAHEAIYYFDRVVLPHSPKYLFFYEGDNDINSGKSVEETFQDYQIFINMVQKQLPNTQLVIFSIKYSPSRMAHFDKQKDFNNRLKTYCQTFKNVYYLDVTTPMLNAGGKPDARYFVEDMLHMNKEGYALWAGVVKRFFYTKR